jgi:hypothetical protein
VVRWRSIARTWSVSPKFFGFPFFIELYLLLLLLMWSLKMHRISIFRLLVGILTGLLISFGMAGFVIVVGLSEANARAKELHRQVDQVFNVRVPDGAPAPTDANIKLAMEIYGIQVPVRINGPFVDLKMEDRGLTVRKGVSSNPTVYIGREAFQSWGLLGSTLAHEIEIHCRQNFLSIHFQNIAGMDGTGSAEREAYRYELANAGRFGLAQYDQDLIRSTMSYFYPEQENRLVRGLMPVKMILDRLSANGFVASSF